MTFKTMAIVNHTRGRSKDINMELQILNTGDKRHVTQVHPENRRQPPPLISPWAKLVCVVGLLIIMICIIILIVNHMGESQPKENVNTQFLLLMVGGITPSGNTTSVEEV